MTPNLNNTKYVKIEVPVRYDEEDIPNNFPLRVGNTLTMVVAHPSGKIIDFPKDYQFPTTWLTDEFGPSRTKAFEDTKIFNLGMKVTDCGTYTLLDNNLDIISTLSDEYVPDSYSIPGEYGDYLNFNINFTTGFIENWYGEKATFKEFS